MHINRSYRRISEPSRVLHAGTRCPELTQGFHVKHRRWIISCCAEALGEAVS